MIKKFNELYGGEEQDRESWPNAPRIPKPNKSPKEKNEMIKNLFINVDKGEMTHEEFFKSVGEILQINNRFPGTTKM